MKRFLEDLRAGLQALRERRATATQGPYSTRDDKELYGARAAEIQRDREAEDTPDCGT